MLYRITYRLHGVTRTATGSRAAVYALAEYLEHTFRIVATVRRVP